jgi:exportin-1
MKFSEDENIMQQS